MKLCKSNMRLLAAGCVAAILFSGCAVAPTPEKAGRAAGGIATLNATEAKNYEKALTSIQKGEPEKAVARLKKLASANPQHPGLWINLAVACYKAGELQQATDAVTQAAALNDKVPELKNIAGLIAVDQGQYDLAERNYLEAIRLKE